MNRPAAARLILTLLAVALVVPAAAGAAAKKGFLTGSVPKAPATKQFEETVVAYQVAPKYGQVKVTLTKRGTFRTAVNPGLYALILDGWVKGKRKSVVRLVGVKAGKTVAVPKLKAVAADPVPPPIRVSVGQMAVTDPAAPPYWSKAVHSLAVTDLTLGPPKGCKMTQVEDRKYGRYADILSEIRLGKSRFADPTFRAWAVSAERIHRAWAPTHRLTGTIDKASGSTSSGTFRLVNMKTGEVQWERRFELTGDSAPFRLTELVAAAVYDVMCGGPPKLHIEVSGTFAATNTLFHQEAAVTATGTMSYDVVKRAGEATNYDLPAPADWKVSSTTAVGAGGECIVTGALGAPITFPQPAGAGATLDGQHASVFLIPGIVVLYGLVSPSPMLIDCPSAGDMVATLGAAPGLQIGATLGVPTRVTGGNAPNTYDVTVTVTPVTG